MKATMHRSSRLASGIAASLLMLGSLHAATTVTLIDTWSTGEWNYNYPWGTTANGAARMSSSKVSLGGSSLTITATRIPNVSSTADIQYDSGAIYAKDKIGVTSKYYHYTIQGKFTADYKTGMWPAFWLAPDMSWSTYNNWACESDIMEFKGGKVCGQNTLWITKLEKPSANNLLEKTTSMSTGAHTYRAEYYYRHDKPTDVTISYYINNSWKATHNAPWMGTVWMNLIVNLQTGRGEWGIPRATATSGTLKATTINVKREQL